MTFTGFGTGTTDFLAGLSANNTKSWFDAHRDDYERHWVAPAKEFVMAAGEALTELNPRIEAQPKVNGSIFRINRDTRFSQDKTPYKDHLDLWFWEGERKGAVSGYFLRVTPTHVGIGAGAHGFDKERLAEFRSAVVDPKAGKALQKAVDAVEAAGWPVKGESHKRPPRGVEPVGPTQERFLLHGALWCGEDTEHPASMRSGRFVSYVMNRWQQLDPLHRWLVDTLS